MQPTSKSVYWAAFGCVALTGTLRFWPAAYQTFQTVAALPFVIGLASAMFTVTRDALAQERVIEAQKLREMHENELATRREIVDISITSHMAQIVFDHQCDFAEEYIGIAQSNVKEVIKNPNHVNSKALYAALREVREKHVAWVTMEIAERLDRFESVVMQMSIAFQIYDRGNAQDSSVWHNAAFTRWGEITGQVLDETGTWRKSTDPWHEEEQELQSITRVIAHIQDHVGISKISKLKNQKLSAAIKHSS